MIYDLIEQVRPLVQGKRLIDLDTELLAAVNDIVSNIKQKNTVPESLPRRRFSVVDQSEHFTAKPPLKKLVFVRTSFGGVAPSKSELNADSISSSEIVCVPC